MAIRDRPEPTVPLPKEWPPVAKFAIVHALALAHFVITHVRGWCADSPLRRAAGRNAAMTAAGTRCQAPRGRVALTRMRELILPAASMVLSWILGCGGASGVAAGARPGGRPDDRAADARGLATVEISHVSQFEPSSTTYVVRPDGSFELVGTGQDYNYVGHAVFQPPLPADVVADLFDHISEAAAGAELVDPTQAYQPPSTALTSDEVVVVRTDGSRRMAATEEDARALLEAAEPARRVLFERTRVPDGSQAEPTADGWTQLWIEIPGTTLTELVRAVPAFGAVLVSDGQWSCSAFVGAHPAEGGRTVFETRVASGRVDAPTAGGLLRDVLRDVHPSTGGFSTERADARVRMFHIDHAWGSPSADREEQVLDAWKAAASRLYPACSTLE